MSTGVFIDYDNVYDLIEKKYNAENTVDIHIKFIENLWEKFKDENILIFIAFVDFTKITRTGLITELQKRNVQLEHCYSNGAKEEYRKNASDMALCIRVIKSLYEQEIDTYILISSDCDMIPILSELKYQGKKRIHIYSPTSANKDIKEYDISKKWAVASQCFTIEEILGVPIYEDKVAEIIKDDFVTIANNALPFIFDNILKQREKKNEYGFGYIISDIIKGNEKIVKEDAKKLATELKGRKIVVAISEKIIGKGNEYENFRLNRENQFVIDIFKDKIESKEFDDIFVKEGA